MTVAFTIENGVNEGEYLRELNPNYQRRKKEMSAKIERASK